MVEIFVDHNDVASDANAAVGRTSDDHRTQNGREHARPKLGLPFEFGSNIKIVGRFGRKIPEHLVVASGQWLVARFEARRHLAVSPTRVPVQ